MRRAVITILGTIGGRFDQAYTHNNGFRFSCINGIRKIDIHSNTFQTNRDIEKFIITFQSLFSLSLKSGCLK